MGVVDLSADETVTPVTPRLPVRFREIKPDQAGVLAAAMRTGSPEAVRERFAGNRRCFAGYLEDQIACWGWFSQGEEWIDEMKVHFWMQPGEAYIWDCVTLPEYQGNGLYSALLSHIVKVLQSSGINRIWIGSNIENQPSIRGFLRAGFRLVIQVRFFQILGSRFFRINSYPGATEEMVSAALRAFSTGRALRIDPFLAK
jgi:ribosomal protein S18 acetylase RimI-like enzyme